MTINFEPLAFVLSICALAWVFIPQLRPATLIAGGLYALAWGMFLVVALIFG